MKYQNQNINVKIGLHNSNIYILEFFIVLLSCFYFSCSNNFEDKTVDKRIIEQVVNEHLIYGYGFEYAWYDLNFRSNKVTKLPYLTREKNPEKRYFIINGEQDKKKIVEYINDAETRKINVLDFFNGEVEFTKNLPTSNNIGYISFLSDNGKIYCQFQERESWKQINVMGIKTNEKFSISNDNSLLGIVDDRRILYNKKNNSIELTEDAELIERLDGIESPIFSEHNKNIIYIKNNGINKVIALYDLNQKKEFITNIKPVDDFFYSGKAVYFALKYPLLIYAENSPKNKKPDIVRSLLFGMLEAEPYKDYFIYDYEKNMKIGALFTDERIHFISSF